MRRTRKNVGFTLIELLVVIAIIALLLSILTPGLKKARDAAQRVMCGTRLNQIGKAVKMYSDAFDGSLPDDLYPNSTSRELHGYLVYRDNAVYANGKLKPFRLAYLYELNYIEVPEIFYCPANRAPLYEYKSYTSPGPWGTLPQDINTTNQWVRVGYTYYPIDRAPVINPSDNTPVSPATKFLRLNPNLPYASDLLHTRSSLAHQSKTVNYVNALFPDGHVTFSNDQEIFDLTEWDPVDAQSGVQRDYDKLYYAVFRMIRP